MGLGAGNTVNDLEEASVSRNRPPGMTELQYCKTGQPMTDKVRGVHPSHDIL